MTDKQFHLFIEALFILNRVEKKLINESIDDIVLWVECDSYQQEIDGVDFEVTTDSNNLKIGHITFKFDEITFTDYIPNEEDIDKIKLNIIKLLFNDGYILDSANMVNERNGTKTLDLVFKPKENNDD